MKNMSFVTIYNITSIYELRGKEMLFYGPTIECGILILLKNFLISKKSSIILCLKNKNKRFGCVGMQIKTYTTGLLTNSSSSSSIFDVIFTSIRYPYYARTTLQYTFGMGKTPTSVFF